MLKTAIVVSGLPASGKTCVGRNLAFRLGWTFLDKDDFLEALYEDHPAQTLGDRTQLSRLSDAGFRRAAEAQMQVVLVSHWAPRNGKDDTGTPTEWIRSVFGRIVEIHCECLAEIAIDRFLKRVRHPGHLDKTRRAEDIGSKINALSGGYPLGLGTQMSVCTEATVNADHLYRQVCTKLDLPAEPV